MAETQAGKGSLPFDHPLSLGAIGATGTKGANIFAREADLVIGIGTRYSDFTTASKTAFQNPEVRFVNINVGEFDAFKHGGVALVADAREALTALGEALQGYQAAAEWRERAESGESRLGQGSGADLHPRESRASEPGRGHRRGERRRGRPGRRGLRGGESARRSSQALAHARSEELSHGVWLLVHGLRNRGRPGRPAWPRPIATSS